MLAIANFAMKGPFQAIISIILFSALTVWIAPFGLVAGALIALVTLRVGVADGIKVLTAGAMANLGLSVLLLGTYFPGIASIMEYMLPSMVSVLVLRRSNSLSLALQTILIMGALMVIGFHLMVGDTIQWWNQVFNTRFLPVLQSSNIEFPKESLNDFIAMLTMLMAIFLVMLWYSIVLLARYWQAALYYPGRFGEDFRQLRLPKNIGFLAILIGLSGLLLSDNLLIQDLSGVFMAGFLFQGLAIAHHAVKQKSLGSGWLMGLYILLSIFPQALLVISTLGLFDIWIDFRSRWEQDKI